MNPAPNMATMGPFETWTRNTGRVLFTAAAVIAAMLAGSALSAGAGENDAKLQWWRDAKLGLFIHWGPSSVEGVEISWAREDHPHDHPGKGRLVPNDVYDSLYKRFNPVEFDADEWMRLANDCGFKYVVFTAKHHDGFCNWHTGLTDYNIANTPFRRDICRELAMAANQHGLRLGWYYSTRDWTHPGYLVGDNRKYNDYYEGQVRELLSEYGKVDIMWFDHVAGNWSDYTFPRLFEMMYALQSSDLLVNDRAAKFIRGGNGNPPSEALKKLVQGDFDTPEQRIGQFRTDRAWESCITMSSCENGGGWSYRPDCTTIPYEEVIRTLVRTVTGDGNLLLNVGPLPSGRFPPEQVEILLRMGQWLQQNGESIYGTRGGPIPNGEWGGTTQAGSSIYVHVLNWPVDGGPLVLPSLGRQVTGWRGLNVDTPEIRQTGDSIEIHLRPEQRDPLDSIIVLGVQP